VAGNEGQKSIYKSLSFGWCFVHLPIGGNECFTGHSVGSSKNYVKGLLLLG
jgi:hypothetical protein